MCKVFRGVLMMAFIALAGCRTGDRNMQMPPLKVGAVVATTDSVAVRRTFIGALSSYFDVVIQPRVNGYLTSGGYANGVPVRRGQLLFTIDANQLSTSMLSNEANLQSAIAQGIEAENNYKRALPLAKINAISQSQLDQYTAEHKAAQAAILSARQMLVNSKLDVSYTKIHAPIDGVIAHSSAHVGDYVGAGTQFEALTTISNIDTMTVDLAVPMSQYLKYTKGDTAPRNNSNFLSDIKLILSDGSAYPIEGVYDYIRRDINSPTGTIVFVVKFANPDHTLRPGEFARVEANMGAMSRCVMIPQMCVSQVQNINSVWIVKADSTVEYRQVDLGGVRDNMWCITSGVNSGETVVVTGGQKLHDGARIIPVKR